MSVKILSECKHANKKQKRIMSDIDSARFTWFEARIIHIISVPSPHHKIVLSY